MKNKMVRYAVIPVLVAVLLSGCSSSSAWKKAEMAIQHQDYDYAYSLIEAETGKDAYVTRQYILLRQSLMKIDEEQRQFSIRLLKTIDFALMDSEYSKLSPIILNIEKSIKYLPKERQAEVISVQERLQQAQLHLAAINEVETHMEQAFGIIGFGDNLLEQGNYFTIAEGNKSLEHFENELNRAREQITGMLSDSSDVLELYMRGSVFKSLQSMIDYWRKDFSGILEKGEYSEDDTLQKNLSSFAVQVQTINWQAEKSLLGVLENDATPEEAISRLKNAVLVAFIRQCHSLDEWNA